MSAGPENSRKPDHLPTPRTPFVGPQSPPRIDISRRADAARVSLPPTPPSGGTSLSQIPQTGEAGTPHAAASDPKPIREVVAEQTPPTHTSLSRTETPESPMYDQPLSHRAIAARSDDRRKISARVDETDAARHISTKTLPGTGVVVSINDTHPDQNLVTGLMPHLEEHGGLPASWTPVPGVRHPEKTYLQDDPDNPTYFAKVLHTPKPEWGTTEMRLAPTIRDVLNTEEAQEAARANGFATVSLVEPVATFTDQEGRQIVIYPWQEGRPPEGIDLDEPAEPGSELDRADNTASTLTHIFQQNGIDPRDFSPGQCLIHTDSEGNQHLSVTDIEDFRSPKIAEFQQLIRSGHTIPPLGEIPSYEQTLHNLKIHQDKLGFLARAIMNSLAWSPETSEENFVSVAVEALRQKGFEEDALEYAKTVAFPILLGLNVHERRSDKYGNVANFVTELIDSNPEQPLESLRESLQEQINQTMRRRSRQTSPSAAYRPKDKDVDPGAIDESISIENPIEIKKVDTGTVVINRTHPDQNAVNSLLPQVQNGVPDSWTNLFPGDRRRIYVDSSENPQYVAKVRKASLPGFREDHIEYFENPAAQKFLRASNSVVNELRLSPKIKALLDSQEAQDLVRRYGFESITFIEPLLAHIDAATGRKTTYYKWQKGYVHREGEDNLNDPDHPLEQLFDPDSNFDNELYDLFRSHSFDSDDTGARQLIADTDEDGKIHLYYIDTEDVIEEN